MSTPNGKMSEEHGRLYNFAAGPAMLPESVLTESRDHLLNYNGCGRSVMELSHRSKEFDQIVREAEADLRTLLKIPDNYKVLFMQGGATAQFAAIPLNLLGDKKKADYVVTGAWGKKAAAEAKKYCEVNYVYNGESDKFTTVLDTAEWKCDPEAAYLHYTDNETVHGVEFKSAPPVPKGVELVADMSSNFLSKPVDVSKYGLIYAGAQKNAGIAGVTVVIVRDDLLAKQRDTTPVALSYKTMADNRSLYNTPPCFALYIAGLVFKWVLSQGGVEGMLKRNTQKSELVYSLLDDNKDFYDPHADSKYRSHMNVTFRLKNAELEAKFLEEAKKDGLIELKGHRSVGGMRASLYNAMPIEGAQRLAEFMKKFKQANQ